MAENFLNLAPAALPSLDPGDYSIRVSQQTSLEGCRISPVALTVSLATEQIAMDPGQVYSTYPPHGSSGVYERCLPHIILHRETLPWERPLNGGQAGSGRLPWLALLLFSEDEGVRAGDTTFRESRQAKAGVYNPREEEAARGGRLSEYLGLDDDPCRVIDIPAGLFRDILPEPEELPFLAHVRMVSLEKKVTDPAVRGESFSCLVANRYPKVPAPGEEAVGHQAHVVSLEDYADYLFSPDRKSHPLCRAQSVRMFSLFNWEFKASAEDFNFAALAAKLEADAAGYKRHAASGESGSLPPELENLLTLGYCPVDHIFREGSRSVSWYRPPLLPRPPWDDQPSYYFFQDQLTGFDPETGLLDISLSAAWQLGRLMAFRHKNFAAQLDKWRRANIAKAAGKQNRQALSRALALDSAPEGPSTPRRGGPSAAEAGPDEIRRMWEKIAVGLKERVGSDDPAGVLGRGLPKLADHSGLSGQRRGGRSAASGPEPGAGKKKGALTQAGLLALFADDGDDA